MIPKFIGVLVLSYLIGAIPFGLLMGRLLRGVDVRRYGSGKIGGTNVLRTVGVRWGVVVIAADMAKGAATVLLARAILDSHAAEVGAGLAAIIGHDWSVYIKFQGGRGVSTSLGALLVLSPFAALFCTVVALLVIALFRFVSLGSMTGALALVVVMVPLVIVGRQPIAYLVYSLVGAFLLLFQHRDNIARLRSGTERRLGQKAEPREPPPKG